MEQASKGAVEESTNRLRPQPFLSFLSLRTNCGAKWVVYVVTFGQAHTHKMDIHRAQLLVVYRTPAAKISSTTARENPGHGQDYRRVSFHHDRGAAVGSETTRVVFSRDCRSSNICARSGSSEVRNETRAIHAFHDFIGDKQLRLDDFNDLCKETRRTKSGQFESKQA